MIKCPLCSRELTVQSTIAEDFKMLKCYNMTDRKTKTKTKSVRCIYEGYMKDGRILDTGGKYERKG